MQVRNVAEGDLPAVTRIYNEAIMLPAAIWRDRPADKTEMAGWMPGGPAGKLRFVVAESGGRVVGFGALGSWKPAVGFAAAAEISVYVAAGARGEGIGRDLIGALLPPPPPIRVVIAAIDAENAASLKLHDSCGFRRIGIYRGIGTKWGAPRDLVTLQYGPVG